MHTGNRRTENEPRATRDDYLWDGSGEPDPEVQKLEELLGKFRHGGSAPVFPEIVSERRWTLFPWRVPLFPTLSAAAAVVVAIVVVAFLVSGRKPVAGAGWDVTNVIGTARIGRNSVGGKARTNRLGVGQTLETDYGSRARLEADEIGQIDVEPGTRLRLLDMSSGLKRIALDRGTIHTYIWAPPGEFVVDTPSATTVDLGCAYTLQVDDSGAGLVRTSRGWVGFKLNGHEAFIPAGAACATRPKVGPGTPYFEDAASEFRAALMRFDFKDGTPQQRAADLATLLRDPRKRDALTFWHLLARVDESQRGLVYDRLAELVPPPAGVTKEGILGLDQAMLDSWWNALGFDNISVWRHWERSWSGTTTPGREK
jgi:hypothetical protein